MATLSNESLDKKIEANKWEEMTVTELQSQLNIMLDRYEWLVHRGMREQATTIYHGIQTLNAIISSNQTH